MKNTWLTSDWHLGENRFDLMGRPFTSTEQHNNTILTNHNSVVAKDDIVYVVGDVVYQKAPEYLDFLYQFNGRKILIRGNHDAVFTDEQLSHYFEDIIEEGSGVDLTVDGIECWLTHYPTTSKTDKFNLVGHIHGAWKYQLNMVNIGVDVNHYFPVNANKVPFYFNTIKNHYDDDVWVAYSETNKIHHHNGRGKIGSYFAKHGKALDISKIPN